MTPSLIETVARAIYAQWPNTYRVRVPTTASPSSFEWVDKAESWDEMCENTPGRRTECIMTARAAIQAIEAAGHAVVPVNLTSEMLEAVHKSASDSVGSYGENLAIPTRWKDICHDQYAALLSARPRVT